MGLSYDQKVQERIARALERIEELLTPAVPAEPASAPEVPQTLPKRRGRPPKVRNAEDVRD